MTRRSDDRKIRETISDFRSRRGLLKVIGTTGAISVAGCLGDDDDDDDADDSAPGDDDDDSAPGDDDDDSAPGDDDDDLDPIGNWPLEDDVVVLGYNGPLTGTLAPDGEDQERGFRLAVHHLNNGGGAVDHIDNLSGDGILGYEIDSEISDSQGDASASINNLERMIDRDNIQAVFGGISSGVAEAVGPVVQRNRIPFIRNAGSASGITGDFCTRYVFRSNIMADHMTRGIGENIGDILGEDLTYFQVYEDYAYGHSNRDGFRRNLPDGWEEIGESATGFGETDYTPQISAAMEADPDVVTLVAFGDSQAAFINQSRDAGADYEIVVAGATPFAFETAGADSEGVIGAVGWNADIDTVYNSAFIDSFQDEYGQLPTYSAAGTYECVLMYASVVEEIGTLHPPSVIRALEDFSWDWMRGQREFRECDHQAKAPTFLGRGRPDDEVTEVAEQMELIAQSDPWIFECDEEPAASCDMPEYGDE